MKIGILGAGYIGSTLTRRLSASGHDVKVANSRGPETIGTKVDGPALGSVPTGGDPDLLLSGARAVTAAEAVVDVDVLITSVPFNRVPEIAPLLKNIPPETVVIDTSNYYPNRDANIALVDEGQVESVWVSNLFGRPIAKAWNSIGSKSFAAKATPPGSPGRIAIPVAADRDRDRGVTMQLVDETGFDPFYSGAIADSWRHQVASAAYCTDLNREQLAVALASAEKDKLPRRRELIQGVILERIDGSFTNMEAEFSTWVTQLNRAIFIGPANLKPPYSFG